MSLNESKGRWPSGSEQISLLERAGMCPIPGGGFSLAALFPFDCLQSLGTLTKQSALMADATLASEGGRTLFDERTALELPQEVPMLAIQSKRRWLRRFDWRKPVTRIDLMAEPGQTESALMVGWQANRLHFVDEIPGSELAAFREALEKLTRLWNERFLLVFIAGGLREPRQITSKNLIGMGIIECGVWDAAV